MINSNSYTYTGMYTKAVGEIVRHNIKNHCYTDHAQIYITLNPCDKWDDISSSIELCIEDISILMNSAIY